MKEERNPGMPVRVVGNAGDSGGRQYSFILNSVETLCALHARAHLQKFPISPMHRHHKRDKRAHIESERERERDWKPRRRACAVRAVFVLVSSR